MFLRHCTISTVVTCAMHPRLLMSLCRIAAIVAASACLAQAAHAMSPANGDPIVLVYADEYRVSTVDSVGVRELTGRVHLVHGDVTVYCDRATHFPVANTVLLRGSVRIIQGTMTMMMPRGEYDGMKGIATGSGGVRILDRSMNLRAPDGMYNTTTAIVEFMSGVFIDDDSLRITAEQGRYSRTSQESWAWGDVVVRNKKSAVILAGDSAYNRPADAYSRIDGHALLEQTDTAAQQQASLPQTSQGQVAGGTTTRDTVSVSTTGAVPRERQRKGRKRTNTMQPAVPVVTDTTSRSDTRREGAQRAVDTLTIRAQRMEAFRRPSHEWYDAQGDVEIVRGRLATRSSTSRYDATAETFMLRGEPRLWADSLSLHADSIDVDFTTRQLRAVHAAGTAFLLLKDSASGSRSQQIAAETIHITVKDDTVRGISGVRNAASLYFMQGDDGPSGASRTACDSLVILFSAGAVDSIIWRSGVSSEYYPENIIGDGVVRYYLPSYKDIGTRPAKALLGPSLQKEAEIRRRCESGSGTSPSGAAESPMVPLPPRKP